MSLLEPQGGSEAYHRRKEDVDKQLHKEPVNRVHKRDLDELLKHEEEQK